MTRKPPKPKRLIACWKHSTKEICATCDCSNGTEYRKWLSRDLKRRGKRTDPPGPRHPDLYYDRDDDTTGGERQGGG